MKLAFEKMRARPHIDVIVNFKIDGFYAENWFGAARSVSATEEWLFDVWLD